MEENTKKQQQLTEVWGDTVNLKELTISMIMGVCFTMAFYLIGRQFFLGLGTIEDSLAKGYALFVGIAGCLISAVISAKLFKPKRIIGESSDVVEIEEVLEYAHMTVEQEAEALSKVDKSVIHEMEQLELYNLLALIPEDSPNYKPEYAQMLQKQKIEQEKNKEEGGQETC